MSRVTLECLEVSLLEDGCLRIRHPRRWEGGVEFKCELVCERSAARWLVEHLLKAAEDTQTEIQADLGPDHIKISPSSIRSGG